MSATDAESDGYFYVLKESLRLLLVDDDPILREFGIVHLSSETAEVATAADGVEALERIEQSPIDLVLLDLEMPNMDGFEVLRRLRAQEHTADLPVIVVTGREDVSAIDRAFEAGATSFVVKPINWRLLSYQIRYVLRASRAETSLQNAAAPSTAASDAMLEMARQSQHFMLRALKAAPDLRPAAADYADALERLSAVAVAG
jgi:DNA-binding response OmpR family regulator